MLNIGISVVVHLPSKWCVVGLSPAREALFSKESKLLRLATLPLFESLYKITCKLLFFKLLQLLIASGASFHLFNCPRCLYIYTSKRYSVGARLSGRTTDGLYVLLCRYIRSQATHRYISRSAAS